MFLNLAHGMKALLFYSPKFLKALLCHCKHLKTYKGIKMEIRFAHNPPLRQKSLLTVWHVFFQSLFFFSPLQIQPALEFWVLQWCWGWMDSQKENILFSILKECNRLSSLCSAWLMTLPFSFFLYFVLTLLPLNLEFWTCAP